MDNHDVIATLNDLLDAFRNVRCQARFGKCLLPTRRKGR